MASWVSETRYRLFPLSPGHLAPSRDDKHAVENCVHGFLTKCGGVCAPGMFSFLFFFPSSSGFLFSVLSPFHRDGTKSRARYREISRRKTRRPNSFWRKPRSLVAHENSRNGIGSRGFQRRRTESNLR